MNVLPEHKPAVLTVDQPEHELSAGDVGIVVFIHSGGAAYEVEFPNGAVVTLEADQVRAKSQPPSPSG